ncbi:hypothetical protein CBL_06995 [Carabus blaptoides fortunei]
MHCARSLLEREPGISKEDTYNIANCIMIAISNLIWQYGRTDFQQGLTRTAQRETEQTTIEANKKCRIGTYKGAGRQTLLDAQRMSAEFTRWIYRKFALYFLLAGDAMP